jgi:hypothetical protein
LSGRVGKSEVQAAGDALASRTLWREKYAGPGGRVRKAAFHDAGDHGWGSTTLYYSEKGKVRFAFVDRGGWSGLEDWKIQKRVYFNEAGERFFEVHRKVVWEGSTEEGEPTGAPEPDVSKAPDSKPEAGKEFDLDEGWEKNPAQAYDAPPECF